MAGDLLRLRDGQAVDDAAALELAEVVGQPGQPLLGGLETHHAEVERLAVELTAQDQDPSVIELVEITGFDRLNHRGELLGHVGGDPCVGGRGGGEHRDAVGQVGQHGPDPSVVGSEVMSPVGDAVRLVDDQQAGRGRQPRQHLVAEAGVVEPLRADQEYVDLTGGDCLMDGLPLLEIGRVDRDGADAGPLGGLDLVAHQGQQRRDDHRRAGTLGAEQKRRHEVDRRLAPSGALHDEGPTLVDCQRLDRGPLVVAQHRVVAAHQCPEVALGAVAHGVRHALCLPAEGDRASGYQIRTRSSGSSQSPSDSLVSKALWNSSRLRTMLARNSGGLCGSMVRYCCSCSLRRFVRQQ